MTPGLRDRADSCRLRIGCGYRWPKLNRLMIRTVALVNAISELLEGEITDTQGLVRIV